MNWRRQKFTFMVIPDANSQVVRFQLSAIVLISTLVFLLALAVTAIIALTLYRSHSGEVGKLKQQLASATGQYEKIISDKDRNIGDLQTEVAGFSDQAKSIQSKMADIGKLELQLKEIAGISSSGISPVKSTDKASGQAGDYAMDGGGAGGEDLPIPSEAMDHFLEQTHKNFSAIGEIIDEMKPRLEETKNVVLQKQKILRTTPTIWPTISRKVTSLFGIRRDPFTHQARYHAGLDISGDIGDPVYAAADGTVVAEERDGVHGNYLTISHGQGIQTRYLHLSKFVAKVGIKVKKGEIVAQLGNTGRSTGPHLHYEVVVHGSQVDPQPYIQTSRKEI